MYDPLLAGRGIHVLCFPLASSREEGSTLGHWEK